MNDVNLNLAYIEQRSITKRQNEILSYLRVHKASTAMELASILNVTDRTIRNDIRTLKKFYNIKTHKGKFGGVMLHE